MYRLLGLLALSAVCTAQAQSSLTVEWEWKREHQCTSSSPALKLGGVPAGTKTIRVKLIDNDATAFNHGGGEVEVSGEEAMIPSNALKSYRGPCPPNFGSFGHDYTFNVTALAEDGKTVLGTGSGTKNFSSKSVTQ